MLETTNLSYWYGPVIAVNDVTVTVGPGVTGLLGPNGAGKSTFMRLAVGLLRPSAGRVRILEQDPWDNTQLLKNIGYVPEGDAPWRDRTGREALEFGGQLAGLSQSAAKGAASRALEQVGLGEQANKRVEAYSRGMRQKLKFGLALMHNPDVFILDEPLLGSDPLSRRDLIRLIQDLAKQGRSVLVSTHVLPDLEAMTQRILVLNRGRVMAHGEVSEIRDWLDRYPRTIRVATADPRGLGAELWKWETVLSVQAEDRAIVVRTEKPRAFLGDLQKLLVTGRYPFTSVTSPDDNVEAIFRYLVG